MYDKHFILEFSDGESIALESVITKYNKSLTAFAFSIVRDMEASKDIVQDVFVSLWTANSRLDSGKHLQNYLYTAVKNNAYNVLRASKRFEQRLLQLEREHEPDPSLQLVNQEVIRLLLEAVDSLPGRTAEILKLTLKGYKQEEIAGIMGITLSSVKSMKKSGIDKIKKRYGFLSVFLPLLMG